MRFTLFSGRREYFVVWDQNPSFFKYIPAFNIFLFKYVNRMDKSKEIDCTHEGFNKSSVANLRYSCAHFFCNKWLVLGWVTFRGKKWRKLEQTTCICNRRYFCSVPNCMTFWQIYIHSYCYAPRYTAKFMYLDLPKMINNLSMN